MTSRDIYAQRILADGSIAPGWTAGGVPVCRNAAAQDFARAVPDGSGGAFFVWDDYRGPVGSHIPTVFAQHLLADGSIAPGWPVDGKAVPPDSARHDYHNLHPDGAGGFFTSWTASIGTPRTYVLRFTGDGQIAPGWPATGVLLPGYFVSYQMFGDGAGGVYLPGVSATLFPNGGDGDYRLFRVSGDGTIPAGWEDGVLLRSDSRSAYGLFATSDLKGGALAGWYDYRDGFGSHVFAARVLPSGALAPGWTPNGTLMSDPLNVNEFAPQFAPDGTGGMYLTWESYIGSRNLGLIKRVAPDGTTSPGWDPLGELIRDDIIQMTHIRVIPDDAGGAIVSWPEQDPPLTRFGVFLKRYSPGGVVAVQISLASASAGPHAVALVWSGAGAGALEARVERREATSAWTALGAAQADGADRLRFRDETVTPGARYAYRLAYREDGASRVSDETWVDVPAKFALALEGLLPNPASGPLWVSFTLASAERARLELLDVGGRRVVSRDLDGLGAGRHLVRLSESSVAPGVYWLRLEQGERHALTRGVVTR